MKHQNNYFLKSIEDSIELDIGLACYSGEISYFGLTSKSEHFYRDKIAFSLYEKHNNNYHIIREWNKIDLAILDKKTNIPLALIEYKVCYSFDLCVPSLLRDYVKSIRSDFKKSKAISNEETEIYSILFVVQPKEMIPENLRQVVKYRSSINSKFKKYGSAEVIEIYGEAELRNEFDDIEFKLIRNEKAFGVQCGLSYCVINFK